MRLVTFLFFLICFTNSLAQEDKKTVGKLKWDGELSIEKGYAEDVRVIVLGMNSNADTIRSSKLEVRDRFDSRGMFIIEFDIGQLFAVIFLPDTTTHEALEFVVDTNVPQKYLNDFFKLSFDVGLNMSSIVSYIPVKRRKTALIKFDQKGNKFYHFKN